MDADEDEERGLALGAVDYIAKPIKPAILLARVRAHLELKQARDWLADQNSYHEKWDGSGYPSGLAGNAIPVAARLMALADVFDAFISRRHYKEAFPLEQAISIITEGRGKHFDPDIVDAFLALMDEFVQIAKRYADHPEEPV